MPASADALKIVSDFRVPCELVRSIGRATCCVPAVTQGLESVSFPGGDAGVGAFDLLPDAIVAADEKRRIAFINRAATRLLGWQPGELRGRPLTTIMPPRMHVVHVLAFAGT